jgi:rSAM/selenodomain-associated transferase 1
MRVALCIMAKAPLPHLAKTRLCPPLSAEGAAFLAGCFLRDTVATVQGFNGADPHIAYTPEDSGAFFSSIVPAGFRLIPQPDGDLGTRLARTARTLFSRGYRGALLIGSDTPHLPLALLREGLRQLEEGRVVLGPCEDGGYYLIGMTAPVDQLFRGISWSTGSVLACTITRAREAGLSVSLLPPWYDLDRIEDLARLRHEIAKGQVRADLCHTQNAFMHPSVAERIPPFVGSDPERRPGHP